MNFICLFLLVFGAKLEQEKGSEKLAFYGTVKFGVSYPEN
ncbi:hypothetical protein B739_1974 [Riemerella anatipestifer RA-CH-1]|uniref:Uncharacterized protein n=1 Tax=Riemerella anatipestifer RA-CH-1 TaxID=1228997 RepID=J9QTZ0_RIEAN|nr:hypothetical protein B739_1974 [Riemerella anatipestifer RA-CH-1]